MSLKAVHILFVTISVLLAAGFGAWAVSDYRRSGEVSSLIWGVLSWLMAIALMAYGRWFLKKLKHVAYI